MVNSISEANGYNSTTSSNNNNNNTIIQLICSWVKRYRWLRGSVLYFYSLWNCADKQNNRIFKKFLRTMQHDRRWTITFYANHQSPFSWNSNSVIEHRLDQHDQLSMFIENPRLRLKNIQQCTKAEYLILYPIIYDLFNDESFIINYSTENDEIICMHNHIVCQKFYC